MNKLCCAALSVLVLLPVIAFAAEGTPSTAPILTPAPDQRYLLTEVEVRDYVHYLPGTDQTITGIIESFHENGAKASRKSVVDGFVQGVWMEWYDDGRPRFYGEWKDSKAEGLLIYFSPNGEISERSFAYGDLYSGPSEGWTKDGAKAYEAILKDNERISYTDYTGDEGGQAE